MNNLILNLMNNPYAWLILSLIAIVSFIMTIIFALKNKKSRRISFSKTSYGIVRNIENELHGLEIRYNNNVIDSLTISKIIIWNDGNIKIEETDFASTNPFAIEAVDNCKILNASILHSSEVANNFEINFDIEKNKILIHFEFIDPDDGVIIQVVHSGKSSNLNVTGKIKSGQKIRKYEYIGCNNNIASLIFKGNYYFKLQVALFMSILPILYIGIKGFLQSFGIIYAKTEIIINPTSLANKISSIFAIFMAFCLILLLIFFSRLDKTPRKIKTYLEN